MKSRTLGTAEERAVSVVDAAVRVFAVGGYRATPVNDVAAAAGISPAYVFRLFPTKRELFVAAVHECFDRIIATVARAADDSGATDPDAVLGAMAGGYARLIADRSLIMMQVHALAASDDEEIRAAFTAEQARAVAFVAERSGAAQPAIQLFFARGQLCHLVTALGIEDDPSEWAHLLGDGLVHAPREQ
jgi:AcrR family transcriptional regulator